MANITSTSQIAFCNNRIRPAADLFAQSYKHCVACSQEWTALGGGSTAVSLMQSQIQDAANRVYAAYDAAYKTEKLWFLYGGSSFIASDGAALVIDGNGVQDPGRPPMTGLLVNQLMTQVIQFQNWLLSATESFTDSARNNLGPINTVLQVCSDGPNPIVLADMGNFINRCNELAANYQANTNQNLNFVLGCAVNPNS